MGQTPDPVLGQRSCPQSPQTAVLLFKPMYFSRLQRKLNFRLILFFLKLGGNERNGYLCTTIKHYTTMKQKLLITCLCLAGWLMPSVAWADVEINETNFPDANFRALLMTLPEGKDGVFTDKEIAWLHNLYFEGERCWYIKMIRRTDPMINTTMPTTRLLPKEKTQGSLLIRVAMRMKHPSL